MTFAIKYAGQPKRNITKKQKLKRLQLGFNIKSK